LVWVPSRPIFPDTFASENNSVSADFQSVRKGR
jgi:hypothetical protein